MMKRDVLLKMPTRRTCLFLWILSLLLLLDSVSLAGAFSLSSQTDTMARRPISALHSSSTTEQQQQRIQKRCDVAVFGGGFGGLYTALELHRRQPSLKIVLVEPSREFVFLPLLYDLTVGSATEAEVCPSYTSLLANTNHKVQHLQASLEGLESETGCATLQPAPGSATTTTRLQFSAAVIGVGASPTTILQQTRGATEYAQPFYTSTHAKQTRRLLNRLSSSLSSKNVAVVGGGFGGVELAACVARKLSVSANSNNHTVTLLSRGPPMAQTRAEPWVTQALHKLGVSVVDGTVLELSQASNLTDDDTDKKVMVTQRLSDTNQTMQGIYDAVLWTAGSAPSKPIPDGIAECLVSPTNRLAVDNTLQCLRKSATNDVTNSGNAILDNVWALGDCAQVLDGTTLQPILPAPPKTAQCAIQQATVVADNVCQYLTQSYSDNAQQPAAIRRRATFTFRDAGTLLTLGGRNGAILAPQSGPLSNVLEPLLDTTSVVLQRADRVVEGLLEQEVVQQSTLFGTVLPSLLSLGSHGLGGGLSTMDNNDQDDDETVTTNGSLVGTLSGLARRAIYAVAQPTTEQRVVSLASATLTTAVRLVEEASDAVQKEKETKRGNGIK